MLMSVTQRTREIGVRKAIGARRRDIVWQFMTEAVVSTVAGGIIGVIFGGAISLLINLAVPSLPSWIPLWSIVLGVAVSMSVGLFISRSMTFPLRRHNSKDPRLATLVQASN
jgi:putative ABC transport system permease protein